MDNELKPCPFCGNKASYHRAELTVKGRLTDSVIVRCTKCCTRTRRHLFDYSTLNSRQKAYVSAANSWNRRVEE